MGEEERDGIEKEIGGRGGTKSRVHEFVCVCACVCVRERCRGVG